MSTRFSTLRKTIATWLAPELKFTPASSEVNWQRIETLVHGPGASDYLYGSDVFNTAVLACLFAISTAYTEPPLTVYRKLTGGKVEELPDQPLQALLDQPTPENQLTIDEIRFWLAWAKHTDGNAYLIKVRSGDERTGNVVELWPVSPTQLSPYTEPGSGDWITHYRYQVKPGVYRPIPVENVIHLKAGLDDRDMRRGISRLKHLVRQITSDNEAEKFTATLLGNYAVPGLVVWPTNGGVIDPDDADRISAKLRQKFGGENRGNIAVMSKESRVEQFGFSPDEINMPGVHSHAEERISGVMGIPALLAGLGAGLQRSIQDNGRQLREFFTETKLVPEWNADGRKLTASLRADFTSDKRVYVAHDLTNVRALQEDEDAKYKRLSVATGSKAFLTINEARAGVGLDPIENGDEFAGLDVSNGDAKSLEIFGYHIDSGIVEKNEARERLGLPPINDPNEKRRADLLAKLKVAKAVRDAGADLATAFRMAGIDEDVSQQDEEPGTMKPGDDTAKLMADLDKWRRKALKAFAANDRGRLLEDFTLSVIPPAERNMILELLEGAESEEDIKRIFGYQR